MEHCGGLWIRARRALEGRGEFIDLEKAGEDCRGLPKIVEDLYLSALMSGPSILPKTPGQKTYAIWLNLIEIIFLSGQCQHVGFLGPPL